MIETWTFSCSLQVGIIFSRLRVCRAECCIGVGCTHSTYHQQHPWLETVGLPGQGVSNQQKLLCVPRAPKHPCASVPSRDAGEGLGLNNIVTWYRAASYGSSLGSVTCTAPCAVPVGHPVLLLLPLHLLLLCPDDSFVLTRPFIIVPVLLSQGSMVCSQAA